MKITHDDLVNMHACVEHLDLFDKLFPNGAEINKQNITIAVVHGLDVRWLVHRITRVSDEVIAREYVEARSKYRCNLNLLEYQGSKYEAWKAYKRDLIELALKFLDGI